MSGRPRAGRAALLALSLLAAAARAQSADHQGFAVNRYEPTAPGEGSFLIDQPWYSGTRALAAGLSLNYAHNPLIFGLESPEGGFSRDGAVIAHQLLLHLDVAGSIFDRVRVGLSVPLTLREAGSAAHGVAPLSGGAVGDPRLSLHVRLYGQPAERLSISLGGAVWLPFNHFAGLFPPQVGDSGVRVLPRVVLSGLLSRVRWAFNLGFYYRPDQSIGTLPAGSGNTAGSELLLGVGLAYADPRRRFTVGPEALLSTVLTGGDAFGVRATGLELLAGGHYDLFGQVQLGVAGGVGLLHQPGIPDGRLLLRAAWAPRRPPPPPPSDRDGDGIPDARDACPVVPGIADPDPRAHGCPPRPPAPRPLPPLRPPPLDPPKDKPPERAPEPPRPADQDGDGVPDTEDVCAAEPAGATPSEDPTRRGCPDGDGDGDGVRDGADACPAEPPGPFADPARPGCPAPDRDQDLVPDGVDACPDKSGAPSRDPRRRGCPGPVRIKGRQILLSQPLVFAPFKDAVQKRSLPLLAAVAEVMAASPGIVRLSIECHTDNQGRPTVNQALSLARARAVLRWLAGHGVAAERLAAVGFGASRPIADNRNTKGRAQNRRVEFHIKLAAPAPAPVMIKAPAPAPAPAPLQTQTQTP